MSVRALLFAAALGLCAGCGAIVGPDAPQTPVALFDRVWRDFDMHYPFFVQKNVNWDSLGAVYRAKAVAATTDNGADHAIAGLLSQLHDDHVVWRGGRVATGPHGSAYEPLDPEVFVKFVPSSAWSIDYGFVDSSVGYISIGTFDGKGWLPQIDTALAALQGVTSLIIDVRNNEGGFLENAIGVAGRFADRTTTVAFVRYRNGPAHTDFTAPIAQAVSPSGSRHFPRRVFVLTGRNTISAAEFFVMSMQALGHTTVVGDTTAGETGSPWMRELQNGWSYQFPESVEYTVDGREFEGVGFPPDVVVRNEYPVWPRRADTQLARAIILARLHSH